jgi:hypothetical protein
MIPVNYEYNKEEGIFKIYQQESSKINILHS